MCFKGVLMVRMIRGCESGRAGGHAFFQSRAPFALGMAVGAVQDMERFSSTVLSLRCRGPCCGALRKQHYLTASRVELNDM